MAFFIGLLSMYLLVWLVGLLPFAAALRGMEGIWATTLMFLLVGFAHFRKPEKLEAMIPEHWPYRRGINYLSGAAEIVLALGLPFIATRFYAAWGLIFLLLAVFPANIYVARKTSSFYNVSRLFFQPVYMAWVYWFCLA